MINLIFIFIFLFLLLFYLRFLYLIYCGLNKLQPSDLKEINKKISVIIPFRNESGNILKSLKSLEEQNYPKDNYEILYINDSSTDDSYNKICSAKKADNIIILNAPKDDIINAHKKRAIRLGIEKASGDIIITTDADCIHHNNWLKTMSSYFDEDTGLVSGPVQFISDNSLFGRTQKLEFAGLIIAGAGLIGINRPVICNAANLAFRKEAFLRVNGYDDNLTLTSGDDEFLMQKIWKETEFKIKFCVDKETIVLSPSNKNIKEFYMQRKRWASKGLFYADKFLILKLVFIYLFYLCMPVQLLLALFLNSMFAITLLISLLGKIIFEYNVLKRGMYMIFHQKKIDNFFITEIFHIPYIIIAGISGVFGNYSWKGRRVRR